MKKTGLPLAYPNIPQLSRAAAFPPDTRFPRRGTGGGREGANPAPQRERMQTKRPAHIVRAYSIRSGFRLPSVNTSVVYHNVSVVVKCF